MSSATEQELIVCVPFSMYLQTYVHMYCALECQCSNCLHVLWFSAVLLAVSHSRGSTASARTVAGYPGSAVLCSLASVRSLAGPLCYVTLLMHCNIWAERATLCTRDEQSMIV